MIITNIKKSAHSRQKYDIYIDDELLFPLYGSDLKKSGIKVFDEISADKFDAIINTIVKKNAVNDALRLISRTDYSSKMINDKLAERKYPYEVITHTVNYLIENNYINDYEYSKRFIKNAFSLKKKGKAYVYAELIRRGIERETIYELTDKYYDNEDIIPIAQKKLTNIIKGKESPDFKDYNKLKDYLLRQGFSYDEVINAIELVKGNYED